MAIDGTWKVTVNTPMGIQAATLNIATSGTTLTGKADGAMGASTLKDGKVNGNKATWKASVNAPLPITLDFDVTVEGDKMTGQVKAGAFGTMSLRGNRA